MIKKIMSTFKSCYHYVNRFQSGRNSKQNLTDIDIEVEKRTSEYRPFFN